MRGPATLEESLSNFNEVGGIVLPYQIEITANGEPYIAIEVQDLQINTEIDPSLFER